MPCCSLWPFPLRASWSASSAALWPPMWHPWRSRQTSSVCWRWGVLDDVANEFKRMCQKVPDMRWFSLACLTLVGGYVEVRACRGAGLFSPPGIHVHSKWASFSPSTGSDGPDGTFDVARDLLPGRAAAAGALPLGGCETQRRWHSGRDPWHALQGGGLESSGSPSHPKMLGSLAQFHHLQNGGF